MILPSGIEPTEAEKQGLFMCESCAKERTKTDSKLRKPAHYSSKCHFFPEVPQLDPLQKASNAFGQLLSKDNKQSMDISFWKEQDDWLDS